MTKIDIISGFLGAGKTTLIRKLLQDALQGTKVVLIENEFGEIGIDGGFLQESGIEIREMNSGCICCSLVGDFNTSLMEVMKTYTPERILIEPSGVGKLSDVANAIQGVADEAGDMEISSAVTVIDCTKAKLYIKNFGEFFTNQIANAGTIILTRTDKADDKKIEETVDLIREHNDKATIITTPIAQLDGKAILDTIEGNRDLAAELMAQIIEEHSHDHDHDHEHHHHHHDHDDDHECCHHHHDHDDDHECCHHHDHDHDHHDHHHGEAVPLTADEEGVIVHRHEEAHSRDHHEHHHHGHAAEEVFMSFGMETPAKYEKASLERMLKALDDRDRFGFVLRAKGVLETPSGDWIEFDYVPEETELREGAKADVTGKIVVIGTELNEEALEALFRDRA